MLGIIIRPSRQGNGSPAEQFESVIALVGCGWGVESKPATPALSLPAPRGVCSTSQNQFTLVRLPDHQDVPRD